MLTLFLLVDGDAWDEELKAGAAFSIPHLLRSLLSTFFMYECALGSLRNKFLLFAFAIYEAQTTCRIGRSPGRSKRCLAGVFASSYGLPLTLCGNLGLVISKHYNFPKSWVAIPGVALGIRIALIKMTAN